MSLLRDVDDRYEQGLLATEQVLVDGVSATADAEAPIAPPALPRRRRSWWRRFVRSRALGWVAVALLLAYWQWSATTHPTPQLPSISEIATTWWQQMVHGPLWGALVETLEVMAKGYVIAAVLGVVVGLLMARVRVVYALLEPVLELLRPIPIAAYIPLLIFYLGIGSQMKTTVVAVAAFFPVLLNSFAGGASVPATTVDTARTFRLGWFATMREIILPAASPSIFVGLRLALSISLVVAVVTGMIAGSSGVGYYLLIAQQQFSVVNIFAGALTVAGVGYLLNALFLVVERRILHWHVGHGAAK